MKLRNISENDIILTLNQPDKIQRDELGNLVSQKIFGNHLLRVFFIEDGFEKIIITAYKTSKIKKYK
ncbi:DUF4258 domain-containing protein [Candidatus Lokiarchaeum ossiferum]|uniref:DUF4258 domain-containing protein n=1 Tax=Candidatus Lokiarchaeum ossiferum TaxID=2951803 RepID=UPI00352CEB97